MQGGKVNQVNIVLVALKNIGNEKDHDDNRKMIREKHMKFTTNYMLNGLCRDSWWEPSTEVDPNLNF